LEALYAKLGPGIPEVQAASPVLYSQGLIRIGQAFTAPVQVAGIRLPERLEVTDFASGLFCQAGWPYASFSPPVSRMLECSREHLLLTMAAQGRIAGDPAHQGADLVNQLRIAAENAADTIERLRIAPEVHEQAQRAADELAALMVAPEGQRDEQRIEQLKRRRDMLERDDLLRPPAAI